MRRGSISSLLAAERERERVKHVGEKNANASRRQGEIQLYVERGTTAVALNYSRDMVTWNWPNDYDYMTQYCLGRHIGKYRPNELCRNIFQRWKKDIILKNIYRMCMRVLLILFNFHFF